MKWLSNKSENKGDLTRLFIQQSAVVGSIAAVSIIAGHISNAQQTMETVQVSQGTQPPLTKMAITLGDIFYVGSIIVALFAGSWGIFSYVSKIRDQILEKNAMDLKGIQGKLEAQEKECENCRASQEKEHKAMLETRQTALSEVEAEIQRIQLEGKDADSRVGILTAKLDGLIVSIGQVFAMQEKTLERLNANSENIAGIRATVGALSARFESGKD